MIPFALKKRLVDDWAWVTGEGGNLMLAPDHDEDAEAAEAASSAAAAGSSSAASSSAAAAPSSVAPRRLIVIPRPEEYTVDEILTGFINSKKTKEAQKFTELMEGLRTYFDKSCRCG